MNRCLFIAISTGQNIANVLPILERFEPGDEVLWLESAQARQGRWTEPASQVLKRHGVGRQHRLDFPGEDAFPPSEATTAIQRLLGERRLAPVFVANGGTKLQALALHASLQAQALPILYNLDRPCAYAWLPQGISGPIERCRYRRHRLDLPDVLALRGYELAQIKPDSQPVRLWPSGTGSLPETFYGEDIARTIEAHDKQSIWYADPGAENGNAAAESGAVPFKAVQKWLPDKVEVFRAEIAALRRVPPEDVSDGTLSSLYHRCLKLQEEARSVAARQNREQPPPLGPEFEAAVARRVLRFLDRHPSHAEYVQSVWANAAARRAGAQNVSVETDLLLLFKNGVLLHIECKSHTAANKDLDARLLNLQQGSSLQARMLVCSPLFTGYADHEWFKTQHQFKTRIEGLREFSHLPFDLPGQPPTYPDPDDPRKTHSSTSFGEALETFLKPWLAG